MTVGILIYPDAEVLDFCGPFEVFATTRLSEETRRETVSPIRQLLVTETTGAVRASGGMRLLADVDFTSCPRLDILLVPGGSGIRALHASAGVSGLAEIHGSAGRSRWPRSAPVPCCWPRPGLLVGKRATTHFHSVDFFRERFPRTSLLPELPDRGGRQHHHRQQHPRRHGHGAVPGGADIRTRHRARGRAADGISISRTTINPPRNRQ